MSWEKNKNFAGTTPGFRVANAGEDFLAMTNTMFC